MTKKYDFTYQTITRKGWRTHLAAICTSDVSVFFSLIAGEGGRKARPPSLPRAGPPLSPTGVILFGSREKCDLIADLFEAKFRFPLPRPTSTKAPNSHPPCRLSMRRAASVLHSPRSRR